MQAALDRAAGRYIYARLVDDFHNRFVGRSKLDGDFRFECPGCGGAVYATAGGPPRLDARGVVVSKPRVGHFAHYRKTCAYQTASAEESEEHRALKYFVADVIERCHGWQAALEVPGPGWRADVHAEVSFDLGATIGRHTGSGREIVFEIQHTREAPAETRRRTALYERAGCQVVWLFDDDRARQVGRDPAVVVNPLPDGTYSVTRGVWCPRQGSPRVDLATFVRGVLDGLVSLEEIPSGPRSVRRWEWVWASDMKDLERRRRNHELSAARAIAANHVVRTFARHGIGADIDGVDLADYSYATTVRSPHGTIAVHPRPALARGNPAQLRTCHAVVVARPADKVRFVAAGLGPRAVVEMADIEGLIAVLAQRNARPRLEAVVLQPPAADPPAARPLPALEPKTIPERRDDCRWRRWLRRLWSR